MADILGDWGEFPKIGLVVENRKKFYTLSEAVPLWDSGYIQVSDTGEILHEDFSVKKMTDEENRAFQVRVDNYSAGR
jgi:hypothetical protein